ncbi:MAG: hypothetical protein E6772_07910 [Dysgonomonas sp.]|nr:hypothetical protein [Dysgonomonas sp.]
MSLSISKKGVVFIFFIACISSQLQARKDTIIIDRSNRREVQVVKYYNFWNKLIPRYAKVQLAGSIGLVSVGAGWDYGRNKQWETDFIVGILPKYDSKSTRVTFTLKQNFIPWKVNLGRSDFSFNPLSAGAYINTIAGQNYWSKNPDRHSNGYYTLATKIRFNVYLGQRFNYHIKESRLKFVKTVSFFYEVHTNDLYIIQAVENSYLKPKDYLHLAFGLKFQFL